MIREVNEVGVRIKRGETPSADKAVICLEIVVDVEDSKSDQAVLIHAIKGIRSFQHQSSVAPKFVDATDIANSITKSKRELSEALLGADGESYNGVNSAYWRSRLKMKICGIMADLLGSI